MKTAINILALTLLIAACGDNKGQPDARQVPDGPPADAQCSNCPPAPALGTTQIDRMGRPAINTALNKAFSTASNTAARDAYNADKDVATWVTTWTPEFMNNLAIIDVLDGGICGNGLCEASNSTGISETNANCPADCSTTATPGRVGCGNQVLYNGNAVGGGTPAATSYQTLGGILANDELYLDTSKSTCAFYLAVEFGVATGLGNTTCGGRAPEYDVIDYSYSALAMGIKGFTTDGKFTPLFGDGVAKHGDLSSVFPYLGAPHEAP